MTSDDRPEPPGVSRPYGASRRARYDVAAQAIGAVLAIGVPWISLAPVLVDMHRARQVERVDDRAGRGSAGVLVVEEPLRVEHQLLYDVARSHLRALAMTTPPTSRIDHWFALEILDSLHEPRLRPHAGPVMTESKRIMYSVARAAIEALSTYGLDPRKLLLIRDALDRSWQQDLDQTSCRVHGGA
jgi:hypothetical protein